MDHKLNYRCKTGAYDALAQTNSSKVKKRYLFLQLRDRTRGLTRRRLLVTPDKMKPELIKALGDLKLQLAELLSAPDTEADARAAAMKLMAECGVFEVSSGTSIGTRSPVQSGKPQESTDLIRSPYYGMGIGEAAKECLRIKGTELYSDQIWEELSKVGFQSAHEYPQHAAYDGLRKRAKNHRDVVRLPGGAWGLSSWYTDDEKAKFASHFRSEKTSEGMQTAKANGAIFGRRLKFTEDVRKDCEARLKRGERVADIAEALSISSQTIRNRYKKAQIDELRMQGRLEEMSSGKPVFRVVSNDR